MMEGGYGLKKILTPPNRDQVLLDSSPCELVDPDIMSSWFTILANEGKNTV